LWLDQADANRMVHSLCDHALQLAESAAGHAPAKVDTAPEGIPCPVCRQPLARSRVDAAWLDIDVCAHHGTWFDRGELQRVARSLHRPQAADWRQQPAPPAHCQAAGAVAATAAAAGGVGIAAGVASQLGHIAEANPVATEVAGELAVEGVFAVVGVIFEALLD
jgi:Zn-finger nucleic acid-binding protein